MRIRRGRSTGGALRVANGQLIPNVGESKIQGTGSTNGNQMEMTAQVADVTKPLAAATGIVDNDNLIILHKTGGIVKKLSRETEENQGPGKGKKRP